ncbi:hypothetical protein ZWY2020_004404 [Hordeum vulgare]|nr:hypothetical protein ZWY2020_004404 [Hordeum vulgare]
MYQHLAPENTVDKCGHHYTICLDLKNQWFEVLDSLHSGDDTSLTYHAEIFVGNLKETWNRHYGSSMVQINHFPIEYVLTDKQGNGGKEERFQPSQRQLLSSCVKLAWNWVTNGYFNKRPLAQDFIDEAVKTAYKKYK